MKVFISWSGDLSGKVGKLVHQFLKLVIQATEPFLSSEDLDKGVLWASAISDQLATTSAGILCLTAENRESPWILFEAGALAKGLQRNRVHALLIDLEHSDLRPPLSQFNNTTLDEEDVFRLIKGINSGLEANALSDDILRKAFDAQWPAFARQVKEAKEALISKSVPLKRQVSDMMEEVLETCRSIHRSVSAEDNRDLTHRYLDSIRGFTGKLDQRAMSEGFADFLEKYVDRDPFLKMDIDRGLKQWASKPERGERSLSRLGGG